MKRIKKFESFNTNFGKVSDYLNKLLKKGGDLATEVWNVTKRESEETKIVVRILSRMLKGEEVSDREKEFVKRQSGDIIRILPLIAIQGIPVPLPITPLLILLGKKYGFDFLPKDHRKLLDLELELSNELIEQLGNLPESGMGYHIVDVILKNGRVLEGRVVINSSKLILNPYDEIGVNDIEEFSSTTNQS